MVELVVLAVAAFAALLYREHLIAKERQAWTTERHALLERIQRPERPPVAPAAPKPPPSRDELEAQRRARREYASIGSVAPPKDD